jgi:hypothetical protein
MRKDMDEERAERIATSLEEQFHMCRKETDRWLEDARTKDGSLYGPRIDCLLKLWKTNTQLAQSIARIETAKSRNSKTK